MVIRKYFSQNEVIFEIHTKQLGFFCYLKLFAAQLWVYLAYSSCFHAHITTKLVWCLWKITTSYRSCWRSFVLSHLFFCFNLLAVAWLKLNLSRFRNSHLSCFNTYCKSKNNVREEREWNPIHDSSGIIIHEISYHKTTTASWHPKKNQEEAYVFYAKKISNCEKRFENLTANLWLLKVYVQKCSKIEEQASR